ncbi:MAG TPA: glycine--tRNA ligase, partial [Calditrichia bacterium]|nr:glycine--tRNA ligase [Calditrichia bacterium]
MDKLVSLCKRRGFIFQSSEIYGGINSCYDYGPMGVELKKNIKDLWWKSMVYERDDIEGLDASILMHPTVWKASGHVDGFTDPMLDCRETKSRYREDQLLVYVPLSGEGLLYAFPEGYPERIEKKLRKAKVDTTEYQIQPLTEIDKSLYSRLVGPDTDEPGTLTEPRMFNLMFKTFM